MPNDEPHISSTAGGLRRRYLFAGALIALVVVGIVTVVARDVVDTASSSEVPPPQSTVAPSSTTTLGTENTVVMRLQEIIQIREQAFRERDASLFEDVYTSDCSCLRAGREAIAALKKENIQWRNRSVSIDVQSVTSINNNLWEVVALFVSHAFRIETERGSLVREAPAERLRYRFLLVRTEGSWRLGQASLVDGQ
jgi:uncharacterized protein (TIGR02246 family)